MDVEPRPCVIVVPCFNEARRLPADAFTVYCADHPHIRFVFVNDGSTDETAALLTDIVRAYPERCMTLRLPKNRGKAEAVRQGFLHAFTLQPSFVGFWDADLATPLQEIDVFLRMLQNDQRADMVFGTRDSPATIRVRGRLRHALGNLFAFVSSQFFFLPTYDTQCGAKLFRVSPMLTRAFATSFRTRWLFDIEVFARMAQERGREATVASVRSRPIPFWTDVGGSKFRPTDYLRAVRECWMLLRAYPVLRRSQRS